MVFQNAQFYFNTREVVGGRGAFSHPTGDRILEAGDVDEGVRENGDGLL